MSADGIEQHVIMGALILALMEAFFARNLQYAVCATSGSLILGVILALYSTRLGSIVEISVAAGFITAPSAPAHPEGGPPFIKECGFHGKF